MIETLSARGRKNSDEPKGNPELEELTREIHQTMDELERLQKQTSTKIKEMFGETNATLKELKEKHQEAAHSNQDFSQRMETMLAGIIKAIQDSNAQQRAKRQ